jgi:hypothetical protein
MARSPKARPTGSRSTDLFLILIASGVLSLVSLYVLQLWDIIAFTGRPALVSNLPSYLYYHLRSALFFFAADLIFFTFSLLALVRAASACEAILPRDDSGDLAAAPQLASLYTLDAATDMAIATFVGIGVVYTAIGMESALVSSLGGISGAEDAARQGAWEVLRRLVDGGLVLALSTTIAGGIGGYVLRLVKHVAVAKRLARIHLAREKERDYLLIRTAKNVQAISEVLEARFGLLPNEAKNERD